MISLWAKLSSGTAAAAVKWRVRFLYVTLIIGFHIENDSPEW